MSKKYNQLYHDSGAWKKQFVQTIEIDPVFAAELMRLNTKNRPVRTPAVKQMAGDMSLGNWKFNGDSIRISKTGVLLDGQHRLMALIESGTTQRFNIQTGLEDEVFDVIDIGRLRTASDAVAVKGHKNYGNIAGAIKLIIAYDRGSLRRTAAGGIGEDRISNHDVIKYLETKINIDDMNECATFGNKFAYKAKFFSPNTYCAFLYMFMQKDRDAAFLFFDLLTSGENISATNWSPVFLLRNKLIKHMSSAVAIRTVDKYAVLIKAWNAFRAEKQLKQLSWQPSEDFPTIQ
jgi:hypothetical protein